MLYRTQLLTKTFGNTYRVGKYIISNKSYLFHNHKIWIHMNLLFKVRFSLSIKKSQPREMAQRLGMRTALSKDLSSVPSTRARRHTATCHSSSWEISHLCLLGPALIYMHMYTPHTHTQIWPRIMNINLKRNSKTLVILRKTKITH